MTQLESARKNKITPLMKKIARLEKLEPEYILSGIAQGSIVIPANINRRLSRPCGIGKGLRTKVNANIGTSAEQAVLKKEIKKLKVSLEAKTDTVMDLSTGGDIVKIRREIIKNSPVPLGTVPIYQAAINTVKKRKTIVKMEKEDIFSAIESQAKDGVDFMTIHAGITSETLDRIKKGPRLINIVSRGGAFLATWMLYNKKENPLYENFNRVLDIARRYDITLSLGDGMRPGSISDSTDRTQIQELILLGQLAREAQEKGIQVMIEGPGHIPVNEIEANVILQKKLCNQAPFYVLGPLVTDIAAGYDHISAAIGGAIAAGKGADFLCYVTASEHIRLPSIDDVREGVIAARIAAHAGDIVKGVKGALEQDIALSKARKHRNWKEHIALSIDPRRSQQLREKSKPKISDVCTMCGEYCAIKVVEKFFKQCDTV
ncbi:MAG: phosphomethylpyrimidine synthase ThiC [Candidatus Omnitrophota bacterium]|nr:phosphomethylpyrimidine synthase ThiC [Candidatus Omnitrophota bacterium]